VARAALSSLFALAPQVSAAALLDALLDPAAEPAAQRALLEFVAELGADALPEVVRRVADAPPQSVGHLVAMMGAARAPAAVQPLLGLLARSDLALRREVVRALALIDAPEARDALPGLLGDPDEEIVRLAATRLGVIGAPTAVQRLLRPFAGLALPGARRAQELRRAMIALGWMRAAEAVPALRAVLLRRIWLNRRVQSELCATAAQALVRIGGPEARRALERAASRAPSPVAALCRRLLARPEGGA
jgi:HEAT repeat protein